MPKRCWRCQRTLPSESFYVDKRRADGRQGKCRDCNRTDTRDSREQNQRMRQSAISTLKLERGCIDCGYNADPRALEFDHVRGEKLDKPSSLWGNWTLFFEEVEKCEVRCSNCHRIITSERSWEEHDRASV